MQSSWTRFHKWILALVVLLFATVVYAGWQYATALPATITAQYVGRESCVSCHQTQHQLWQGSHHDRAMELPSPETVLGNFNNQTLISNGVTSRFFMRDGKYFIETAGRDGKIETFPVDYTFGVDPLQQYMTKFPDGRVHVFQVAWATQEGRWFDIFAADHFQPHEWLYWTNPGMSWNHQCAECHSTNLQKNYNVAANTYHTTWTDIDVSCEACHGPGSLHNAIETRGNWFDRQRQGTGLAKLKNKDYSQPLLDTCGPCHSRRASIHPGFVPGKSLLDFYLPSLLDTDVYYPDGQIRDEDYEYGSFHLSLMYHKNVRCTDCHDPHTAKVKFADNRLCLQCHLPGKYDVPAHTHHLVGSPGAQCVECHMPETNYMVVDPRRDHSFRVPRPDLTESLGIPNACNRCHSKQNVPWVVKSESEPWASKAVAQWYGTKPWPKRIDFAAAIAGGREGKLEAERPLAALVMDLSVPDYVRASAMSLLRNYPNVSMKLLDFALEQPHPLIRLAALRHLEEILPPPIPGEDSGLRASMVDTAKVRRLADRLVDENRLVRNEAARLLAKIPRELIPHDRQTSFREALQACLADLHFNDDNPISNQNLGDIYMVLGESAKAEKAYQQALKLDPYFYATYLSLARLYDQRNRGAEAQAILRDLLAKVPRDVEREQKLTKPDSRMQEAYRTYQAEAHYSLGLLLATDNATMADAARHLEQAVKFDPQRHRAFYNLGLAWQHLGKPDKAEEAFRQAATLVPTADDYRFALAILYAQQGRADAAAELARGILARTPQHLGAHQLLQQLRQQRPGGPPAQPSP